LLQRQAEETAEVLFQELREEYLKHMAEVNYQCNEKYKYLQKKAYKFEC